MSIHRHEPAVSPSNSKDWTKSGHLLEPSRSCGRHCRRSFLDINKPGSQVGHNFSCAIQTQVSVLDFKKLSSSLLYIDDDELGKFSKSSLFHIGSNIYEVYTAGCLISLEGKRKTSLAFIFREKQERMLLSRNSSKTKNVLALKRNHKSSSNGIGKYSARLFISTPLSVHVRSCVWLLGFPF